jgi:hypothetical protein
MTIMALCGRALCVGGAAALLSGCTASYAPITAPPKTTAEQIPTATTGPILYASANSASVVYEFSYPLGGLVGKVVLPKGTISLQGLCSDPEGNVYVTALSYLSRFGVVGYVYKYQHGAKNYAKDWKLEGVEPFGCSYDRTTHDLAVTTASLGVTSGSVLVIAPNSYYSHNYYSSYVANYYYCGYDDKGNLFVNGEGNGSEMQFVELRKGASTLTDLALQRVISVSGMGQVQWDGHHITVEDLTTASIYQLQISGSKAHVVGTTRLSGWSSPALSWIQGSTIIVPNGDQGAELATWKYPAGGRPTGKTRSPSGLFGVTIDMAGK